MMLNEEETQKIVESCESFLGDGKPFSGKFVPTQQNANCTVHNPVDIEKTMLQIPSQEISTETEKAKYDFDMNNLLADGNKDGFQFVSPFGSEKPVEEK